LDLKSFLAEGDLDKYPTKFAVKSKLAMQLTGAKLSESKLPKEPKILKTLIPSQKNSKIKVVFFLMNSLMMKTILKS
jgi:hypothetical protein